MPPGVKQLILITGGVYLVQLVFPAVTVFFGLYPPAVLSLEVWRLFTYMFLHGGLFHLLMNMFVLYMFGSQLEQVWGPAPLHPLLPGLRGRGGTLRLAAAAGVLRCAAYRRFGSGVRPAAGFRAPVPVGSGLSARNPADERPPHGDPVRLYFVGGLPFGDIRWGLPHRSPRGTRRGVCPAAARRPDSAATVPLGHPLARPQAAATAASPVRVATTRIGGTAPRRCTDTWTALREGRRNRLGRR